MIGWLALVAVVGLLLVLVALADYLVGEWFASRERRNRSHAHRVYLSRWR